MFKKEFLLANKLIFSAFKKAEVIFTLLNWLSNQLSKIMAFA